MPSFKFKVTSQVFNDFQVALYFYMVCVCHHLSSKSHPSIQRLSGCIVFLYGLCVPSFKFKVTSQVFNDFQVALYFYMVCVCHHLSSKSHPSIQRRSGCIVFLYGLCVPSFKFKVTSQVFNDFQVALYFYMVCVCHHLSSKSHPKYSTTFRLHCISIVGSFSLNRF